MPVRKRRQNGWRISNFTLLLVLFKWHSTEGVKWKSFSRGWWSQILLLLSCICYTDSINKADFAPHKTFLTPITDTRHLHWVLTCTAFSHQAPTLGAELLQYSDQIYQLQNATMMCTAQTLTALSVTSSGKRLTVNEWNCAPNSHKSELTMPLHQGQIFTNDCDCQAMTWSRLWTKTSSLADPMCNKWKGFQQNQSYSPTDTTAKQWRRL